MFIPLSENISKLIVDKSEFIALVLPISDVNEVNQKMFDIKKRYPKASHYLYAYRFNNIAKSNDDGEPNNIAKNFISLIDKKNIDQVLAIVVRYFGGVKLGASRLLRTYLNVLNLSLDNVELGEIKEVYLYRFLTDYQTFNELKKANYQIEEALFNEDIDVKLISTNNLEEQFKILKINPYEISKIKKIVKIK